LLEQLLGGTFTTGLVASAGGGFGVVATDACVAPAEGASWTPGAFELPHAAREMASKAALRLTRDRLRIERGRVANVV
jgi:hypothetical protein